MKQIACKALSVSAFIIVFDLRGPLLIQSLVVFSSEKGGTNLFKIYFKTYVILEINK